MSTKPVKFLVLLVLGIFVLPLLAACSGGGREITVTETEDYHMNLSSDTAKAGDITFHVKNDATTLTHEFVVVKTDLPSGQLPLDSEGNVNEDQMGEDMGEAEDLEPGATKDLTVNLTPGHYVLMCNVEGHYQQGMHTDFTVE